MKNIIYFMVLSEVFKNCGFDIISSSASNKKSFLMKRTANEIFLKRTKRFLVFEKGTTLTFQGNIAKSIIPPAPRGLNMITEYTLVYDLPSDLNIFDINRKKTNNLLSTTSTTTTSRPYYPTHQIVPFSHDYLYKTLPENFDEKFIKRKYFPTKKSAYMNRKCFKNRYDIFKKIYSNTCLKRIKRYKNWSLSALTNSERMFYDLIEKWSLIHGFLPRYCFMRTLCESFELLLPYGHSLLHDIIHIFLRYTKPWAFHHKIFGRSLRQRYSIDECAKLYGLYCRVSWLDFITNAVHGSRAADFMR